jgi:putative transposase
MLRNRRIARAISDSGMGELRRLLGYKTNYYGSRLLVADPFFPSSKTCSGCGWVKAKLPRPTHVSLRGLWAAGRP